MPFLGKEPRSEALEAPPTPSANKTCTMATGRVRDGGVVVVDVGVVGVVVAVVVKDVINLTKK